MPPPANMESGMPSASDSTSLLVAAASNRRLLCAGIRPAGVLVRAKCTFMAKGMFDQGRMSNQMALQGKAHVTAKGTLRQRANV
eukprot:366471-Chlamydomonas_euryale.AAC.10